MVTFDILSEPKDVPCSGTMQEFGAGAPFVRRIAMLSTTSFLIVPCGSPAMRGSIFVLPAPVLTTTLSLIGAAADRQITVV